MKILDRVITVTWSKIAEGPVIREGEITAIGAESLEVRTSRFSSKQYRREEVFESGSEAANYVRRLAQARIDALNQLIADPLKQLVRHVEDDVA